MIQATKKLKAQSQQHVDLNPVEAFTRIGGDVASSIGSDVLKAGSSDIWKQILGNYDGDKQQSHGDLSVGQEIDLSNQKRQEFKDIAPGIDYRRDILYGSEKITKQQTRMLEEQIELLVMELKQLAQASQELQIEFKDVVVTQNVVKPGKYHQNFFEWMLIIIKTARMRVEDAGSWLKEMHGKKGKRQQQKNYWEMFKTHGTTFGLSNERVVATQTG